MVIGVSVSFLRGTNNFILQKFNPFLPKYGGHVFCQAAVLSVSAKLSCQSYKLSSAKLQASQFCQDPISILFPAKGEGWGDLAPNTPMSAASWADITHIKQVNYTNISQLLSRLSPNTSRVKPEQGERERG